MKERPILFKPHMVRAVLEGRKTQTRRMVKGEYQGLDVAAALPEPWLLRMCPYGEVGDRLWVREAWSFSGKKFRPGAVIRYKESGEEPLGGRWRPSIHMPRSVSRLTLEITDVRLQRLHDLTEQDALAEGVIPDDRFVEDTAIDQFRSLWMQINGAISWLENPWVWAVTFKPLPDEEKG